MTGGGYTLPTLYPVLELIHNIVLNPLGERGLWQIPSDEQSYCNPEYGHDFSPPVWIFIILREGAKTPE